MTEQSNKWDEQWRLLLTHCHGEDVEADGAFKANLLGKLKTRMAEASSASQTVEDAARDENWTRLLKSAYVPCHPRPEFKASLLEQMKKRQSELRVPEAVAEPDDIIRTILVKSYQPIEPRREFQTRLLENLKERQRHTAVIRRKSRRRAFAMSALSSLAAAAMVMFVMWVMPAEQFNAPSGGSGLRGRSLPVPETAFRPDVSEPAVSAVDFSVPAASFESATVVPASFDPFEVSPAPIGKYSVAAAFAGAALPAFAVGLRNIEIDAGEGWTALGEMGRVALESGQAFRASGGMGHIEFSDGSLLSLSPETMLDATNEGLTVRQGFALVVVPEFSNERFRLHFDERDIAIEPGTELAVMVEDPSNYAAGGAPAPMVMVVEEPGAVAGGLALARGKNGVGPLFARHLYRLDNYVTPDLPSRAMCETECEDLNNMFKRETVRQSMPMAALADSLAGSHDMSFTTTIVTPVGFARKGDQWVAETYDGRPTVKLRYLSDDYFGFANLRRDLARSLALGGQVIIDGEDGNFYEIYK